MGNILFAAGIEIVDAKYFISVNQKSFAKMRAEEACASGDKNPLANSVFHTRYFIIY
jgi:hypothetical protein